MDSWHIQQPTCACACALPCCSLKMKYKYPARPASLGSAALKAKLTVCNQHLQGQGHPAGVRRTVQCLYNTPLQTNVLWEALTAEDGGGGVVLRQLGHPEALQHIMLHCTVEAIAPRPSPPQLPGQIPNGVVAPVVLSRMIRYIRADNSGIFISTSPGTLQFDGRSLLLLIDDLANKLNDNINNITLCVRAGFLGRITPLVVDLPLSEDMMDIVVLTTGSAAATELQHPNVDAE